MDGTMVIDGRRVPFDDGETVLDVAQANGIGIPTLCFNPLNSAPRPGGCRLCVIEIVNGGRPGLQSSCTLPAADGLEVATNSESVFKERRTVVEFLLSTHVQDCRNCPSSGDCTFSELCKAHDINGVPVCSECPNQKEGCYLARGVLCLGPVTYANCDGYCTRQGYPCEGCHTVLQNEDVLRLGLKAYRDAGFGGEQILEAVKVFSFDSQKRLRRLLVDMDMLKEV